MHACMHSCQSPPALPKPQHSLDPHRGPGGGGPCFCVRKPCGGLGGGRHNKPAWRAHCLRCSPVGSGMWAGSPPWATNSPGPAGTSRCPNMMDCSLQVCVCVGGWVRCGMGVEAVGGGRGGGCGTALSSIGASSSGASSSGASRWSQYPLQAARHASKCRLASPQNGLQPKHSTPLTAPRKSRACLSRDSVQKGRTKSKWSTWGGMQSPCRQGGKARQGGTHGGQGKARLSGWAMPRRVRQRQQEASRRRGHIRQVTGHQQQPMAAAGCSDRPPANQACPAAYQMPTAIDWAGAGRPPSAQHEEARTSMNAAVAQQDLQASWHPPAHRC